MKKISIYAIVVIVLLIVFIIPLPANKGLNDYLVCVATLASGIGAIGTLIIAMLLYQKFSLDGILISKNTETVFKLLEILNNDTLYVKINDTTLMLHSSRTFRKENYSTFYNIKLIFNLEYSKYLLA